MQTHGISHLESGGPSTTYIACLPLKPKTPRNGSDNHVIFSPSPARCFYGAKELAYCCRRRIRILLPLLWPCLFHFQCPAIYQSLRIRMGLLIGGNISLLRWPILIRRKVVREREREREPFLHQWIPIVCPLPLFLS